MSMNNQNKMNLTTTQQEAIAFYENNLSYVEGFGLTNLDREERLMFKQGRKLIEAMATEIKRQMTGKRSTWTPDEVGFILNAYVRYYDTANGKGQRIIDDAYLKQFSTHDTADFITSQIKFLDKENPLKKGMRHVTKLVADMAHDLNPERFRSYEESQALCKSIES